MKTLRLILISFLLAASALFVAQCGGGGDGGDGTLNLGLSDAPVDIANSVVVEFSEVQVHSAGGTTFTFPFSNSIDLLTLNGGVTQTVLSNAVLPAGDYTWIRLMVNSPAGHIVVNGTSYPLEVPSGEESGLKLNRGFVVPAGGLADFTVDFDLRQSVHLPSSGYTYVLRPTLRIVDNTEVGNIAGTVSASLINKKCSPAVYAFAGNVSPDDVDNQQPNPVNTTIVVKTGSTYQYYIGFLETGPYTVSFTCEANKDDPSKNDSIVFPSSAMATVSAHATTTHNF